MPIYKNSFKVSTYSKKYHETRLYVQPMRGHGKKPQNSETHIWIVWVTIICEKGYCCNLQCAQKMSLVKRVPSSLNTSHSCNRKSRIQKCTFQGSQKHMVSSSVFPSSPLITYLSGNQQQITTNLSERNVSTGSGLINIPQESLCWTSES